MFGNIGFTRPSRYVERQLTISEKKMVQSLECKRDSLAKMFKEIYDDLSLTDEEVKEKAKPIEEEIEKIDNEICKIKYKKRRA